ncbi:LysR family transcriptional regulator [Burkholderia sp. FERM BP-3421]|uniref:LysR family transcriptional regulator n=1 Tax=Burkholderia sp. FERM BP-3421 TaxID=1494466 RepID=UPI002361DC8D|nr:LysR family transcriptional regulator [Burkholderia sp. FERM BP-3421]WDD91940.1 LysR family transcriptional regulator [Burkholderia sp. FERM BP-3421]
MPRHVALEQLDFRLLKVFVTLYRERHVGRAADLLGMSQPAVSTLLARLRQIAGDPLFTRSAQGMQPSALACQWADPIATALGALESALNVPSGFDPSTSRRTFSLYMTDVGQALLLNRIVARLGKHAPDVRIQVVGAWDGALAERLADGQLDVAFGWIPQLKASKTSTLLFKDRYVGVQAPRAPADAARRYAVANVPHSAHQIVIERMRALGIQPSLVVPSFFMLPEVLAHTALTAVLPERLVQQLAQQRGVALRVVELPFRLPQISIRLHWSVRTWRDEGIDWLRDQIVASAAALPPLRRPGARGATRSGPRRARSAQ